MEHLRPTQRVPEEVHHVTDARSGLDAWLVLDSTRLGPAVGGIRTRVLARSTDARQEAEGLAWAMTTKCALAGLGAGGGKTVVRLHPDMDRKSAFAHLGRFIQQLGGRYVAGADFGTDAQDLAILAENTEHVHINEKDLTSALADAHWACVAASLRVAEHSKEMGSRVAIQGVGSVGGAIAHRLGEEGFHLVIADVNPGQLVGYEGLSHVSIVGPEHLLEAPVDVLAPCALGGVFTASAIPGIQARCVVPGANNAYVDESAERSLVARGILSVPDVVSSAGAVVAGLGETLMGWDALPPHLERLGLLAEEILRESIENGEIPGVIARDRALHRIENAMW